MNKITEELLLGEIEDVYWEGEDSSINMFENDYTGAFFTPDNEDGIYFNWKINDNGVLVIYPENSKTMYFWKIQSKKDTENGIQISIIEYIKEEKDKKPKKNKSLVLNSKSEEPIEEEIRQNNIEILKEIINDYNVWNYSIITLFFVIYFLIFLILINFIIILKDFPFLFQSFMILLGTIFIFRPLFLLANKISYKIRHWIEKN
tara:strand:+ start:1190 stop:1801 length:612 start_codon:yes stop_codon:yes gene_type:complete